MRWVHIFLLVVFPLCSWSGTLITFNIACLGIWGRNWEGCFLLGSVGVIKHFSLWVDSCWPYKEFSKLPSGMSFNLWLYKHLWFLKEFEISLESVLLEFLLFLVGGGGEVWVSHQTICNDHKVKLYANLFFFAFWIGKGSGGICCMLMNLYDWFLFLFKKLYILF